MDPSEPVLYTDDDGVTWLRIGECSQCGECCLGDDPSPANPMFTDAERASAQFCDHCPLLRHDGIKFACAGHGTHQFYLSGCNTFPTRPADMELVPSCSYSWERV